MRRTQIRRSIFALLAASVPFAAAQAQTPVSFAAPATALIPSAPCIVAPERIAIHASLPHLAQQVADRLPVKIVALGSSSTLGYGASTPAAAYPSRLVENLAARLPGQRITVLNRGLNNEESPQMLARLDADVLAEKPALVLWQVGTNELLHKTPLSREMLQTGITRMQRAGTDVITIDPQFAPRALSTPDSERMARRIAAAAAAEHAGAFPRFALMRHWHEVEHLPLETFLYSDYFHMNDWGYACIAKSIGTVIAAAATAKTTVSALPIAKR